MSATGSRVSIPTGVRKTIQNIKEITGNHTDDEIYAMLKECSMDPNETTQKLLFQDTFHEVKRKKDRRKENVNNREALESHSRPGTQGRGVRGGRGNFAPHRIVHDGRGGKNSSTGKDSGSNQETAKGNPSLPGSQETKSREKSSGTSTVPAIANGPTTVSSGTTNVNSSPSSTGNVDRISPLDGGNITVVKDFPSDSLDKDAKVVIGSESGPSISDGLGTRPASSSAVCFSSSDPVLVPSNDSRFPGAVGAIKREVGGQRPPAEFNVANTSSENKSSASETGSSFQVKSQRKAPAVAKNHVPEVPSSSTVVHGTTSGSRPSSNYNNRSQQISGLQKAGSIKEWKPKPTHTINQASGPPSVSDSSAVSAEATIQLPSVSKIIDSEEAASELQKKLENLRVPPRQHVILPNHILVPESEKSKFSFGSLGINFGVTTNYVTSPESEKSSTLSKVSQAIEETAGEKNSSNQNASIPSAVGDYPDNAQPLPTTVPENLSSSVEVDISSSNIQEDNESKHSAQIDNSESQARDISRLPSFVVHQPFDPNYYAQYYRSGADSEGRLSPLPSAGVTTKYNGGVPVLPTPSSQSLQEGAVLSTAGQTQHATQAAGLMQNSIATQQPLPVFRGPGGVHIPHYSPNYIPYGHYISPFYLQPPAIHQYLGNGAFPQQPQASTVYPPPSAVAANGMKYPLPQYKPGTNAANSAHYVMPAAYGAYGSSPSGGYNPNSAETAGNSTSSEDLGSSQFKENNVYLNGQQSEGSAMWVAASGRDISSMPASSFYNLPPQGQHVTFAPTQAGHGNFAGVYHHPAQAGTAGTVHPLLQQSQTMAGAVDMVGPGGNVYQQQPQHAHINWPSNY
ncbi:unnamed protein product [Vicia faba]|uniref:GBF-interacting protein 1 N-terminal domain-containing protein n=1 Tax=Vicia faba TaxID=3906 RepID=A0AAV0ZI93_VICFA|nr:unnamed protein product [Vicia faba]